MTGEISIQLYNADELRRIGFPEDFISEVLERQSRDSLHVYQLFKSIFRSGEPQLIGQTMKDGTVFAGMAPLSGKLLFTTPADAPLTYTFNEAAEYAQELNRQKYLGYDDWRVPDWFELDMLFNNQAAIGEFKPGSSMHDWYWTTDTWRESLVGSTSKLVRRFGDGLHLLQNMDEHLSLRCVRG